jgi:His/Glu/Gln/Arg/opine family amino acid ABC transporter permease subunit
MNSFAYQFDFDFVSANAGVLLEGLRMTLRLSFSAMVFATFIGIVCGIAMTSKDITVRRGATLLVDIIRSIPLLVLILICYYTFPTLGVHTSAFWPTLLALSLDTGAFMGDVIRGAIQGIPKGSIMAARTLGLSSFRIMQRIVFPEVFRSVLPSVTLLYIGVIKLSSLASVVAVYELTHTGNWIIASTFKPLEVYLVVGSMYIAIIYPLILLSKRFETSAYFKRRAV